MSETQPKFIVSTSPHIRDDDSISEIMWTVFITLIPAGLAGIYVFGYYAAQLVVLSVMVAVLTEFCIQKFRGVKITVHDGSAAVTGLLLAYTFPPSVPLYVVGTAAFGVSVFSNCLIRRSARAPVVGLHHFRFFR